MKVARISQVQADSLMEPLSQNWKHAEPIGVPLSPTPLGMQPTKAIRANWENKKYGLIENATVAALHDGENVFLKVTWEDAHKDDEVKDNDGFVDKMALMLPLTSQSSFITMGSMTDPVELWRWSADSADILQIQAKGIGTTENVQNDPITGNAQWLDGVWHVVLQRKMMTKSSNSADFIAGGKQKCGLAIWAGHNQERAGIKSIAMRWIEMDLAT